MALAQPEESKKVILNPQEYKKRLAGLGNMEPAHLFLDMARPEWRIFPQASLLAGNSVPRNGATCPAAAAARRWNCRKAGSPNEIQHGKMTHEHGNPGTIFVL
jgi:hypothetical protein